MGQASRMLAGWHGELNSARCCIGGHVADRLNGGSRGGSDVLVLFLVLVRRGVLFSINSNIKWGQFGD